MENTAAAGYDLHLSEERERSEMESSINYIARYPHSNYLKFLYASLYISSLKIAFTTTVYKSSFHF